MGLPALFSPRNLATSSPPAIDPAALDGLGIDLRLLLDDVRRTRPVEKSPEETAALLRFLAFDLSSLRVLGSSFLPTLRSGINEALTDLVRKELLAADAERKLALRHLEQAVHTYGVLMESFGAALGELPPGSLGTLLEERADQVKSGELSMSDEDRIVLRFQLEVIAALDVLEAPLEELTFWAFRTITDARRVAALPAAVSPTALRGELARVRARRSWTSWDAKEVAKELAPWPTPSP
jgi:hypothetical protein